MTDDRAKLVRRVLKQADRDIDTATTHIFEARIAKVWGDDPRSHHCANLAADAAHQAAELLDEHRIPGAAADRAHRLHAESCALVVGTRRFMGGGGADYDPVTRDPLRVTRVLDDGVHADLHPQVQAKRLDALLAFSNSIVEAARAEIEKTHKVGGAGVLFSGGNDSTLLAHLFKDRVDFAGHANTTIGIEETREYVRKTCADWGLPLIERTAPQSYRELVLQAGFPGPAMHYKMYQRLKERCLEEIRTEVIGNRGKRERVLFLAGRRRQESVRRADTPMYSRKFAIVFASPLVTWSKLDMNAYRRRMEEAGTPMPRNQVSDLIHMSGECLCGSFAKPGELDEIGYWFPHVKAEIEQLEREVEAAGHKRCRWGFAARNEQPSKNVGELCSSCEAPGGEVITSTRGNA